jgi:predicted alpha/beta-fold hydrolase
MVVVHGLEGSSRSPYVRRLSSRALDAGYHVVRLNIRNCGGTEHLGPTLYHSGLTTDLRAVVEQLPSKPLFIVGFSMGGNMALKLAGEWGSHYPSYVKAICAVSPPIDLAECALRIAERRNRIYETRFLKGLRQTLTRKQAVMPVSYTLEAFGRIRTLIDFDNAYTAPAFGYRDAFDYYTHASANRHLHRIQVPTLVVHAQDDPFIPFKVFSHPAFNENPHLQLLAPRFGGHVAFLSREKPRFWAEEQALRFCDGMGARTNWR